ncbi:MAG: hypothetical protein AB7I30_12585, partial [Isosphaeraceae bacterium]
MAIKLAGYFVAFLTAAFLGRDLGPEVYGVYSFGSAAAAVWASILTLGAGTGVVRFLPLMRQRGDDSAAVGLVRSTVLLVLGLSMAGVVIAELALPFFKIESGMARG